jgi:RNA-directed DNA polymerase
MASGSYFPEPVKAVSIAKKSGGERILGVPTVTDRIAQTVVTQYLNPLLDPLFHEDSYGYRRGKSAHDALQVTRERCRQYDWVLEYDIRGLFDHIDHGLLNKALRLHSDSKWVQLYVNRWLCAPMQRPDGALVERERGTPQGGPLSPLLANLFLHYALDRWLCRQYPNIAFCRYADDGIIHCSSKKQAETLYRDLQNRLADCNLEMHPEKSRIVYCKDSWRRGDYEDIQFEFLGYTFRPRKSYSRRLRKNFLCFLPSPSTASRKSMNQQVRRWRLGLKSSWSLEQLAKCFNPKIRGWVNYFSCFSRWHVIGSVGMHLDRALIRWVLRKFKSLRRRPKLAAQWLGRKRASDPGLFAHWRCMAQSMGAQ